jgi:hypothetical protein
LKSVDFPTFGLPRMEIKPDLKGAMLNRTPVLIGDQIVLVIPESLKPGLKFQIQNYKSQINSKFQIQMTNAILFDLLNFGELELI